MADDGSVVARGTGEDATVSWELLDVADDGTFRKAGDRQAVADSDGGLLAAVDEAAGGEALSCDEGLSAGLVAVTVGHKKPRLISVGVSVLNLKATDGSLKTTRARGAPLQTKAKISVYALECRGRSSQGIGAPSWVVNDLLHHTAKVTVSLSIVQGTELGRSDPVLGVGREDSSGLCRCSLLSQPL